MMGLVGVVDIGSGGGGGGGGGLDAKDDELTATKTKYGIKNIL